MEIGVIEIPTKKELFVRKMEEQILSGKLKVGDSLPACRRAFWKLRRGAEPLLPITRKPEPWKR